MDGEERVARVPSPTSMTCVLSIPEPEMCLDIKQKNVSRAPSPSSLKPCEDQGQCTLFRLIIQRLGREEMDRTDKTGQTARERYDMLCIE
jgi:hypothetical protein